MGSFIKTRRGIHDGTPEACSDSGLLILELPGAREDMNALAAKLETVSDINGKLVKMSL